MYGLCAYLTPVARNEMEWWGLIRQTRGTLQRAFNGILHFDPYLLNHGQLLKGNTLIWLQFIPNLIETIMNVFFFQYSWYLQPFKISPLSSLVSGVIAMVIGQDQSLYLRLRRRRPSSLLWFERSMGEIRLFGSRIYYREIDT